MLVVEKYAIEIVKNKVEMIPIASATIIAISKKQLTDSQSDNSKQNNIMEDTNINIVCPKCNKNLSFKKSEINSDGMVQCTNCHATLKIAISSTKFYDEVWDKQVDKYKNDLLMFYKLRQSVAARYSDEIDYKKYESQIQKLIDAHIDSDEVKTIVKQVNIFEIKDDSSTLLEIDDTYHEDEKYDSEVIR